MSLQRVTATVCVGALLAAACASAAPPDSAVDAQVDDSAGNAASASTSEPTETTEIRATVSRVIDGDTVILDFDGTSESVRLIGIDTPEPRGGIQAPECYGDEASRFTEGLIPEGTQVVVTRDVEPRDVYDRLLAYLHRADDGLFVNLAIAEAGFAAPLHIAPNGTFADEFAAAAAAARASELGLWGACGGPDVLVAD